MHSATDGERALQGEPRCLRGRCVHLHQQLVQLMSTFCPKKAESARALSWAMDLSTAEEVSRGSGSAATSINTLLINTLFTWSFICACPCRTYTSDHAHKLQTLALS